MIAQTLDNTLGAVFLGVVGSAIIYGVSTLQVYLYYHVHFHNDTLLHKVSVGVLWVLDTLHLFLTIHCVYCYLVKDFGNINGIVTMVWSIKLQVALNVIIILLVQSLYAVRVWILGGHHGGLLSYLVVGAVAAGFAIGAVLAIEVYNPSTFAALQEVSWAIEASLATSTALDVVIAAVICYYLRKSRIPHSRLNSKISTLMQYALSSGAVTSACSTSALITYALMPNNFIFLGLEFLLTKFYVMSFLAMLNARQRREPKKDGLSHSLSLQKVTTNPSNIKGPYRPSTAGSSEYVKDDFSFNSSQQNIQGPDHAYLTFQERRPAYHSDV